jgi:hypothetical protein
MKVLILVATEAEAHAMSQLARKAGLDDYAATELYQQADTKPTMKQLREKKLLLDHFLEKEPFDYVITAGETAARMALDMPVVNINKLRGRDFEYKSGTRITNKKKEKKNEAKT